MVSKETIQVAVFAKKPSSLFERILGSRNAMGKKDSNILIEDLKKFGVQAREALFEPAYGDIRARGLSIECPADSRKLSELYLRSFLTSRGFTDQYSIVSTDLSPSLKLMYKI